MSKNATTMPAAAVAAAGAEVVELTPPSPKRSLVRYGAIALVLAALLGGGGWIARAHLPWGRAATPEIKHEPAVKATVALGSVVVNLGRPETRRYLKISVELGVPGPKDAKEIEE